ncbi:hypothetical protein VNI00_010676 [Paramarasmius palmivorus]|uniref:Uncharacterized protein n=1 Tax=Paramarasmius palmivorus TaxID=297713 RepID=A0AAW0CG52_9AGAR
MDDKVFLRPTPTKRTSKHRFASKRLANLLNDKFIDKTTVSHSGKFRARCLGCSKTVEIDPSQAYTFARWKRHRNKCMEIRKAFEVIASGEEWVPPRFENVLDEEAELDTLADEPEPGPSTAKGALFIDGLSMFSRSFPTWRDGRAV